METKEIIKIFLDRFRTERNVECVFLDPNYNGHSRQISFNVISAKNRQISLKEFGFTIHIKYYISSQIEHKLRFKEQECVFLLADAVLIYDKVDKGKILKEKALEYLIEGPKPITEQERMHCLGKLERLQRAIFSLSETSLRFQMNHSLESIIKYFFKNQGWWIVEPETLLDELKKKDPSLYNLVKDYLNAQDTEFARSCFLKIISYVIENIKNLLYSDIKIIDHAQNSRLKSHFSIFNIFKTPIQSIFQKSQKTFFGEELYLLSKFLKPHRQPILKVALLGFLSLLLILPLAFSTRFIINKVLPVHNISLLNVVMIITFFSIVAGNLLQFVNKLYEVFVYKRIERTVDYDFFKILFNLHPAYFSDLNTRKLFSKYKSGLRAMREVLNALVETVRSGMLLLFLPFIILLINIELAFIYLIIIALAFTVNYILRKKSQEHDSVLDDEQKLFQNTNDLLDGISTIKIHHLEKEILRKFKVQSLRRDKSGFERFINNQKLNFAFTFLDMISRVLVAWVAWYLILNGSLTFGDYFAFLILSNQFFRPVNKLISNTLPKLKESISQALIIFKAFNMFTVKRGYQAFQSSLENASIKLDNVSYTTQLGNKVFEAISLYIETGSKVLITEERLSGKSVFLDLLRNPSSSYEGEIYIGSVRLEGNEVIGRNICSPLLEEYVFNDTILENIRLYDNRIPIHEIIQISKAIGFDDLVNRFPEQYETIITNDYSSYSYEFRTKLIFIRNLIKKPNIILIDNYDKIIDDDLLIYIDSYLLDSSSSQTIICTSRKELNSEKFNIRFRIQDKQIISYENISKINLRQVYQ